MYNDKITSIEEASANFEKLFDFSKGEIEKKTSLKFNNYIAKRPIIDDRIILGGNRLFFLEPLEATAIQAYLFWAQRTFWWIIDKRSNPNFATQELYKYTTQLQNFILWHYVFGSKYNTPFWRYAQEFTINDDEFHKIVFAIKKFSLIDIIDDRIDIGVSPHGYGQWMPWSFKNWYEGMKNDKS